MGLDLTVVSVAWLAYAAGAVALMTFLFRAPRVTPGLVVLGALLVQQTLGTLAGVVLFAADSADLILPAFRNGAIAWLAWCPIVFLAGPLLLEDAGRRRLAWALAGVAAIPGVVAVVAAVAHPAWVLEPHGLGLTLFGRTVLVLTFVAFACTVAILAHEALATPAPLRRARLALLASAFAAEGAFHVAQNAAKLVTGGDFHGFSGAGGTEFALVALAALVLLGALARAVHAFLRDDDADRRWWARFIGLFIAVSAVTGVATAGLIVGEEFRHPSGIVHAAWDLASLGLLVFASLRYQLFDIERHARRGVVTSVVVFFALGTFIVVENLLENVLSETYFAALPAPGYVAAFFVTGASIGVVKVVQHASKRLLPHADLEPAEERRKKEEVYRAAVEGILLDGHVSPTEANTIKRLRAALNITDADHARIEGIVRASMGRPAAAV